MKRSLILSVVVILCCAIGHSYDFSYEDPGYKNILYYKITSEGEADDPYNIAQGAWADYTSSTNPDYYPSATCEVTYKSAIEGEDGIIYNSDYDITGYLFPPYVAFFNGKRYLVKKIGDHAFENCDKISSMTLVVPVGKCAFKNCTSANYCEVAGSEIEDSAFFNCNSITTLRLISTQDLKIFPIMKRIGDAAFYGCTSLNMVYAYDYLPDVEVGKDAFFHQTEKPKSCELQLLPNKDKLREILREIYPWSEFLITVQRTTNSGIDGVEAEANECDDSVYGLGGQLLRHSGVGTAGLPAGLYIHGGKIIKVN